MAENKLVGDILEIRSSNYLQPLSKHILDCAASVKYTDVQFTANDKTYNCHLLILSASSEFFTEISKLSQVDKIISDYSDDVIKAMFEYLYTGIIRVNIDDVVDLVHLTNRLNIKDIKELLLSYVNETMDVHKCLKIIRLSANLSPNTYRNALNQILKNFMMLYNKPDFVHLKVQSLIEILQSDDLNVSSEDDVFKAVKLWVDYDEEGRQKHLEELLNCIRLQCLTLEFLTTTIMPYFSSCPKCVVEITKAMQSIMNPNSKSKTNHRKSTHALLVVGSWDDASKNYIEMYDPVRRIWNKSKELKINRKNYCVVQLNDSLMIIGGHNSSRSDASDEVNMINLKTGDIETLSSLHQSRYNAAAVVIHRSTASDVYVIGGTGVKVLGTLEKWNSNTKVWRNKLTQMPQRMHAHSAAVLNGNIYVSGGHKRTIGTFNTLIMYSPLLNTWEHKARMNFARHAHSSAAINGKLYVAGGCLNYGKYESYISNVESYDLKSDTWTEMYFLPSPRTSPSIYLYRDKFICIGGNTSNGLLNEVLEYDEENSKWINLSPLNLPREGSFIFVVPKTAKI